MKRDVFFLSDKLMEETEELCLQREQKAVSFQFVIPTYVQLCGV